MKLVIIFVLELKELQNSFVLYYSAHCSYELNKLIDETNLEPTGGSEGIGQPGPSGPPGPSGSIGPARPTGDTGDTGGARFTGPSSIKGPTGQQGPAGPTGGIGLL